VTALPDLLRDLSQPAAYPYAVQRVEVRQTHISLVFLAGGFVYKVKKPVKLPFLDFTTLDKRELCCKAEVRLNRRLAPQVYLDVVPVARTPAGIRFEAEGEVVDWAVKMVRLPDEATLEQRLRRGEVREETVSKLAQRVAAFHAAAHQHLSMARFGAFTHVAGNARDNLKAAARQAGTCLSPEVLERLEALQEECLSKLHTLINARSHGDMIRDTHGDLHLDHIYLFPDKAPPNDLVIIDCIEFNNTFRFADPVADMAFTFMDFCFHARRDLASAFANAYFAASGDKEGRKLLPFYSAYRAMVRGKVEGIAQSETEIPAKERAHALQLARAHWLLALVELAQPRDKPCMLLIGGLPGSGKTTLARRLAEMGNFHVLRSDVIRKELSGVPEQESMRSGFDSGIYTPDWDKRVYRECLRRAETLLWEGQRVIVDASFRKEEYRRLFLDAAVRWGVPGWLLLCEAPMAVLQQRVGQRQGDASDADAGICATAAARWEAVSGTTQRNTFVLGTEKSVSVVTMEALSWLKKIGLG
jgi:uncharacterized protein